METIDNVLKYIQLYTECNDFTLQRIRVLLERLPKEKVVEKVIVQKEVLYIQKKTYKEYGTLQEWASNYLKSNNLSYEDIAAKNRKPSTLKVRNKFCIEAYKNGYGYSTIGKYLNMDHVTIMHSVNKIKTK